MFFRRKNVSLKSADMSARGENTFRSRRDMLSLWKNMSSKHGDMFRREGNMCRRSEMEYSHRGNRSYGPSATSS